MKCSDCKLWKTEDCRNNPGEKNLNYAEAFACFNLKEEYVPTTEDDRDDMDSQKEVRKARNRVKVALIIGLVLILIAAFCAFLFFVSAVGGVASIQTAMTFFTIACIAALASVILWFAALVFGSRYMELKGRIKNPVYEARKTRNRALVALFIGLVLIIIAACCVGAVPGGSLVGLIALVVAAGAGLASIFSFVTSFVFFLRYVELKERIKNPEREEADKPKYPGF